MLRSIRFSLEIVGTDEGALLREHVAGACCGSKVPRVYRPLGECNLRIFNITSIYFNHELCEKVVRFFIYSTALDQSKLSNFVECISHQISHQISIFQIHQIFNISCFPQFNLSFEEKNLFPKMPKNHPKIYTKPPNSG